MAAKNDDVTKADNIQKWLLMKETWIKGSKQVCGMTKGPPRHKETWWWNRDVEKAVAKRRVCCCYLLRPGPLSGQSRFPLSR